MNILLINPRGGREKAYPLGLAYISAAVQREGHRAAGCDMSFDARRLPTMIRDIKPCIVGITTNCDTIREVPGIINAVTMHVHPTQSRPTFVVGGPGITVGSRQTLDSLLSMNERIFLVSGDGEQTIVDLITHIRDHHQTLPPAVIQSSDAVPEPAVCSVNMVSPDYGLFPLARYSYRGTLSLRYPYAPLVTSRGCVHNCTVCAAPRLSNRQWQPRTPTMIVSDMETTAAAFDVHDFHIEDDDFIHDPDRLDELCDRIHALPVPIIIECMNGIRPDELSPRVISALDRGRCRTVTIGVETTVPRLGDQLNRPCDRRQIEQQVAAIRNRGMTTGGYYMLGLPDETADMARTTVAGALESGFDLVKFSLFRPVPGSSWEDKSADPTSVRAAVNLRRRAYVRAYLRPRALRALYGRVSIKLVNLVLTRIVDALGGP